MMVTLPDNDLRGVVHQLRQLATYLEAHIPHERDGDLPTHQRLDYVVRDRTFSDAEAARERTKGKRR